MTVIGGGSNLLVGDGGIRGLVVLARTPGERAEHLVEARTWATTCSLRVGAQAPLSWVGRYAAERGWSGTGLGRRAAGDDRRRDGQQRRRPRDRAEGSLVEVVVFDDSGRGRGVRPGLARAVLSHTRLKREPRPRSMTVLESVLRLPKGDPAELVALADEQRRFRKRTQPTGACAGSTFANPPGDFAGRLLEEAGLKGFRSAAPSSRPSTPTGSSTLAARPRPTCAS